MKSAARSEKRTSKEQGRQQHEMFQSGTGHVLRLDKLAPKIIPALSQSLCRKVAYVMDMPAENLRMLPGLIVDALDGLRQ